jgi:methyl-accepting chemotaxis protein
MKLLTQTTLSYLFLTLLAFGLGGIYTYQTFQNEVRKETDWYLREELNNTFLSIEKGAPIEALENDKLQIEALPIAHEEVDAIYTDTLMEHPLTKQMENFRKVTMIKEVDGQLYYIHLVDLVVESDDINDGVVQSLSRLFIVLVLVLLVANFFLSRWLFAPFYSTLREMRRFQLRNPSPLNFPKTFTREFKQLNSFLDKMTTKVQQDYRNLKEFSENASHEMQTPPGYCQGQTGVAGRRRGTVGSATQNCGLRLQVNQQTVPAGAVPVPLDQNRKPRIL